MTVQYSHTEDADDDGSVFTYCQYGWWQFRWWWNKWCFSVHTLMMTSGWFKRWCWPVDDSEDDCKRCSRRWQEEDWRKMITEEYPAGIDDEDVWCCTKNSYDI